MDASVGEFRDGRVVRDDDDGPSLLLVQPRQRGHHLRPGVAVQIARRLVGQDDAGIVHQRPGDGHPLLLPTGELRGLVPHPIGQSDHLQQATRPLPALGRGHAGKEHGEFHVLGRRHRRDEVEGLKHEADLTAPVCGQSILVQSSDVLIAHPDVPRGGSIQSPHQVQQRGFARP